MKLVVGTGWYADAVARKYKTYGSQKIRSNDFRELWWESVNRVLSPDAVVVIDSASPIKPKNIDAPTTHYENIVLLTNPGHAVESSLHYSGWTASVILSLEYAYLSGADVFLYVEQDVVLWEQDKGELRKRVKMQLEKCPFVFGSGYGTPQVLQQSFFAIHRRGIRQFISGLHSIEANDKTLSPETKFHIALTKGLINSSLCTLYSETLFENLPVIFQKYFRRIQVKFRKILVKHSCCYNVWDFGYGRSRPINFDDDIFYFQHGTDEELLIFMKNMWKLSEKDN